MLTLLLNNEEIVSIVVVAYIIRFLRTNMTVVSEPVILVSMPPVLPVLRTDCILSVDSVVRNVTFRFVLKHFLQKLDLVTVIVLACVSGLGRRPMIRGRSVISIIVSSTSYGIVVVNIVSGSISINSVLYIVVVVMTFV